MSSSALAISRLLLFACSLLVMAPVGLWLLWSGVWPRRRGQTPFCAGCGYNLTGNAGERCPECGGRIAEGGVVFGERRRSPLRIVSGIVCLAPLLLLLAAVLGSLDWYQYSPTSWVIADLQGARPLQAWREIERRVSTGPAGAGKARRCRRVT